MIRKENKAAYHLLSTQTFLPAHTYLQSHRTSNMDYYSIAWLISDLGYFYVAWTTLETFPLYSYSQMIPPLLDIPYHLSQESADWAWTEQVAAILQISAIIYAIVKVLWPHHLYTHLGAALVTLVTPVLIFQSLVGPHYPPPGESLWETLRHPNRTDTPHFILCHTQGHILLLLNYAIIAHGLNQGAVIVKNESKNNKNNHSDIKRTLSASGNNATTTTTTTHNKKANIKSV
jgi:hypothetical protein